MVFTPNYRAEQFQTISANIMLTGKCEDICEDHVWCKDRVKNKDKTVMHSFCNSEIIGKVSKQKQNSSKFTWKKYNLE